jgi:heme-degrading monooxygenase HmoA
LLQDADDPESYFTLSIWQSEAALSAYRKSDLFVKTWKKTKQLFSKPAQAWSTTSYISL